MGVACGTHGGEQKYVLEKVLWGKLMEGDDFKNKSVDDCIILKWVILATRWWGGGWIRLPKDRDSCRAVVDTVMNFRVPQNAGNPFPSLGSVSFSRRTVLHVGRWLVGLVFLSYSMSIENCTVMYTISSARPANRRYVNYSVCKLSLKKHRSPTPEH